MKTKENKIAHQVYFWLKNPEDRQKLIDGVNTLKKIKTVRQIHVGIVAGTEKREVIDTSWGVSLLLFFDDTRPLLYESLTYPAFPSLFFLDY